MSIGYDSIGDSEWVRQEYFQVKNRGDKAAIAFVDFWSIAEVAERTAAGTKGADPAAAAKAAIAKRAQQLGKKPDQLSPVELLDMDSVRFERHKGVFTRVANLFSVESRLGMDGRDADRLWLKLDQQKNHRDYWHSVVLKYPVKKDGSIDKRAFESMVQDDELEILPIKLARKNAGAINAVRKGLNAVNEDIATRDIALMCEDSTYFSFTASPLAGSQWLALPEPKRIEILERVLDLRETLNPYKEISSAELKDILDAESGSGLDAAVMNKNTSSKFDDVLDGV